MFGVPCVPSSSLEEMVKSDKETGTLMNAWIGSRVFIFGAQDRSSLRTDLESRYDTARLNILQQLGMRFGHAFGRIGPKQGVVVATFFERAVVPIGVAPGWGAAILSCGDLSAGRARIKVDDYAFYSELGQKGTSSCGFVGGVLNGLVDVMIGKEHLIEESGCVANIGNTLRVQPLAARQVRELTPMRIEDSINSQAFSFATSTANLTQNKTLGDFRQ